MLYVSIVVVVHSIYSGSLINPFFFVCVCVCYVCVRWIYFDVWRLISRQWPSCAEFRGFLFLSKNHNYYHFFLLFIVASTAVYNKTDDPTWKGHAVCLVRFVIFPFLLLLRVSLLMISSVMMTAKLWILKLGGPNDFAPCYSNGFFDLIYKEEPAIW